jgi:hypothetical protein
MSSYRIRLLTAVSVLAFSTPLLARVPARAETATLGYTTYDESDADDAGSLLGTVAAETDLALLGPKCTPGTRTLHAGITYEDALGQNTFGLSHDVTWSYDCKRVTAISHRSQPTVYQPQYTFAGYLHNSTSPPGGPTATATVQGRFGICEQLSGDVCVLERDPSIVWRVDAQGHGKATTTP